MPKETTVLKTYINKRIRQIEKLYKIPGTHLRAILYPFIEHKSELYQQRTLEYLDHMITLYNHTPKI